MPIYQYKCGVCGALDDEFRQITDRDDPSRCLNRKCIGKRIRDVVGSMRPHTDMGYQTPIFSDALGVHASQVAEAQARFPNHKFLPDGRMVFSSHSERQKVMRDLGYHDRDGFSG